MTPADIATLAKALEGALIARQKRLKARMRANAETQDEHRRRGRFIEAAACAIRAQAFREALADMRLEDAEPFRTFMKNGDT